MGCPGPRRGRLAQEGRSEVFAFGSPFRAIEYSRIREPELDCSAFFSEWNLMFVALWESGALAAIRKLGPGCDSPNSAQLSDRSSLTPKGLPNRGLVAVVVNPRCK